MHKSRLILSTLPLVTAAVLSFPNIALAGADCRDVPTYAELTAALSAAAPDAGTNGGLNTEMWGTIVNRDGQVCSITRTGSDVGDQWPGSRVISAQKANTANSFSLPGLALSTANLFSAVQPGGSLFGLQESNPVDVKVAYRGKTSKYGTKKDPMVGGKIGGVNVFGGGLALYNLAGELVGALGVSGDTSCADHNIAWRTRDALGMDNIPSGVSDTGTDDIIYDILANPNGGVGISASGFGHAICGLGEDVLDADAAYPVGP